MGQGESGLIESLLQFIAVNARLGRNCLRHLIDFNDAVEAFQIKGDAATEIDPPYDGQWTNEIKERYADRAQSILESHIAGFGTSVLERKVYSPADLEAININLVGGDPYGGFCGLDQYFLWRPLKSSINHTTCINHLHHIGASTHPGPGLGGGSGFLLAQSLK